MITHYFTFRLRPFSVLLLSVALLQMVALVGCKETPKEVEITYQRELCKFDENEALRYNPNRFKAKQPVHWMRVPKTNNRILNYRVGNDVEIALGAFKGSVKANVARWYAQYGQEVEEQSIELTPVGAMLDQAPFYFFEMQGTFQTNMGGTSLKKENWSTLAIICKVSDANIVTIKMTGPTSETKGEKQHLIEFAKNLKFITFPEDQQ